MTGNRFGKLTVIEFAGYGSSHKTQWLCKCDCGNTIITKGNNLKNGHTQSCGCLAKESKRNACKTHGLRNHPLYHTWLNIKDRCSNHNNSHYKYYGGRGINICEEWRNDFKKFYDWAITNGYSQGLSIERIDVNKDYSHDNCTWITMREQARNKTTTIKIEKEDGKFISVSELAKELGMAESSIYGRLQRNEPVARERQERKRKVIQYTLSGEFVKEFESIVDASRQTGCDTALIIRCCQGKNKTAMGYKWKYKNNDNK